MKDTKKLLVIPNVLIPDKTIISKVCEFINAFDTYEESNGVPLSLLQDLKSGAYYCVCHLQGKDIALKADTEAVLDPQESEDYKLNRQLYTDTYAYKLMESDAKKGRSFEDIVMEYDNSYRPEKPLKIYGGQHRAVAIRESYKDKINSFHGVRIYYGLTTEQRFEIASVK